MKRDALIACLEAAKGLHSKQWAQTSVEIAFEVCQLLPYLFIPFKSPKESCPHSLRPGLATGMRALLNVAIKIYMVLSALLQMHHKISCVLSYQWTRFMTEVWLAGSCEAFSQVLHSPEIKAAGAGWLCASTEAGTKAGTSSKIALPLAFPLHHMLQSCFADLFYLRFQQCFKEPKEVCCAKYWVLDPVPVQGRAAARDDRRDRTAFETARKEWSKTGGISIRKAVGGGGDHHSEVWLG